MTSNESGVLLQDVLNMMLETERKLGPNCVVQVHAGASAKGYEATLHLGIRVGLDNGGAMTYGIGMPPEVFKYSNGAKQQLQHELDRAVKELLEARVGEFAVGRE